MERTAKVLSDQDAAVIWYERLHRDKVSDEVRADFETWLAAAPAHRQAYESVQGTWNMLQRASEFAPILALRHETALRLTRNSSARSLLWRWGAAAAAVVTVATALLFYPMERPLLPGLLASLRDMNHHHYRTATGERLAFTLSDGSQVTLDTQSDLELDFSAARRRVLLRRGQAFFEVAKDPRRPFVVVTRERQFVAVGTAFNVRVNDAQVKITMVEGTVRVEAIPEEARQKDPGLQTRSHTQVRATGGVPDPGSRLPPAAGGAVAIITAGEQLVCDASLQDRIRGTDPDRDTSWRRGQIIFENERLGEAVAEINRYSDVKIEFNDPSLAELRLSGAFATGRPNVFVEAVTSYFPLKVQATDDKKVVLERRN